MTWKFVFAEALKDLPKGRPSDISNEDLLANFVRSLRREVSAAIPDYAFDQLHRADIFTGLNTLLTLALKALDYSNRSDVGYVDPLALRNQLQHLLDKAKDYIAEELIFAGKVAAGSVSANALRGMVDRYEMVDVNGKQVPAILMWFRELKTLYLNVPPSGYRYAASRLIQECYDSVEYALSYDIGPDERYRVLYSVIDRLEDSGFFDKSLHVRMAGSVIMDTYAREFPGRPMQFIAFIEGHTSLAQVAAQLDVSEEYLIDHPDIKLDYLPDPAAYVAAGTKERYSKRILTKAAVESIAKAVHAHLEIIVPPPNEPALGEYTTPEDRVIRGEWFKFDKAFNRRALFLSLMRRTYANLAPEDRPDPEFINSQVAKWDTLLKRDKEVRDEAAQQLEAERFADFMDVLAVIINFDTLEKILAKATEGSDIKRWQRFVAIISDGLKGPAYLASIKSNYAKVNKAIDWYLGTNLQPGASHIAYPNEAREYIFRQGLPAMARALLNLPETEMLHKEEINRVVGEGWDIPDLFTKEKILYHACLNPEDAYYVAKAMGTYHPVTFRALADRVVLANLYVTTIPGCPDYLVRFFSEPWSVSEDDYNKTFELLKDVPVPQPYFDLTSARARLLSEEGMAYAPDEDGRWRWDLWKRAISLISTHPTIAGMAAGAGIDIEEFKEGLKDLYATAKGSDAPDLDFEKLDPNTTRVFHDIPFMTYEGVLNLIERIKHQKDPEYIPSFLTKAPPPTKSTKAKKPKIPVNTTLPATKPPDVHSTPAQAAADDPAAAPAAASPVTPAVTPDVDDWKKTIHAEIRPLADDPKTTKLDLVLRFINMMDKNSAHVLANSPEFKNADADTQNKITASIRKFFKDLREHAKADPSANQPAVKDDYVQCTKHIGEFEEVLNSAGGVSKLIGLGTTVVPSVSAPEPTPASADAPPVVSPSAPTAEEKKEQPVPKPTKRPAVTIQVLTSQLGAELAELRDAASTGKSSSERNDLADLSLKLYNKFIQKITPIPPATWEDQATEQHFELYNKTLAEACQAFNIPE